jgi:hypothetical protein
VLFVILLHTTAFSLVDKLVLTYKHDTNTYLQDTEPELEKISPAQRENMGEAALVKGLAGDMPHSAFIDFALFAYD